MILRGVVRWGGVVGTIVLMAGAAHADPPQYEIGPLSYAGPADSTITISARNQFRAEFVDWWQPPPDSPAPINQYNFVANRFKLGIGLASDHIDAFAQFQHSLLGNLPQGGRGPGGVYYANTPQTFQTSPILRNAWARVKGWGSFEGFSLMGGRMPYGDGTQAKITNPSLNFLVEKRIKERLIGTFEYTMVGRSFDGGKIQVETPQLVFTVFGFLPTFGGWEINGNKQISDIYTLGASVTLPDSEWLPRSTGRAFWFAYNDGRDIVALDNRPVRVREADRGLPIDVHTLGTNWIHVEDAGPGRIDFLGWGAYQLGAWQSLQHTAWAYTLEAGYQLPELWSAPWIRTGITRGSGDADPNDGRHTTFFQMLPTARIYAQTPFYNMMNNQDVFVQAFLKPLDRLGVQIEGHWLRTNDSADFAYFGGGATSDTFFGFGGVPANGENELAYLVDVTVAWQPTRNVRLDGYYGHGFGQGIVNTNFVTNDLDYAYVELNLMF